MLALSWVEIVIIASLVIWALNLHLQFFDSWREASVYGFQGRHKRFMKTWYMTYHRWAKWVLPIVVVLVGVVGHHYEVAFMVSYLTVLSWVTYARLCSVYRTANQQIHAGYRMCAKPYCQY